MLLVTCFLILLTSVDFSFTQNSAHLGLFERLFDFRMNKARFKKFNSIFPRNIEKLKNGRQKRQVFIGEDGPDWLQDLFSLEDGEDEYLASLFGCQEFEMPCPEWTEWQGENLCSASCGRGVRTLRRYCENSSDTNTCNGNDTMVEPCNLGPCPVWSPWATISPCTKTCGRGQQLMKRICYSENKKASGCNGRVTKVTPCLLSSRCKSPWSKWSKMSPCSHSCGIEGKKLRARTCLAKQKSICRGPDKEVRRCNTYIRCSLATLSWGQWSQCRAPCDMWSHVTRRRICWSNNCTNDELRETKVCAGPICANTTVKKYDFTTPYNYTKDTQWSPWSMCSTSCGKAGTQRRSRKCFWDPITNTRICDENSMETRACSHMVTCPRWDQWSEWSMCSKTCGKPGDQTRVRYCVQRRYVKHQTYDERKRESTRDSGTVQDNLTTNTATLNGTLIYKPTSHDVINAIVNHVVEEASDTNNTRSKRGINGLSLLKTEPVFYYSATPPIKMKSFFEEVVDNDMCRGGRKASHDHKNCLPVNLCQTVYTPWSSWRPCSTSCGAGYTLTTRSCYEGNQTMESCSGVTVRYKSCFSPPCWSEWAQYSPCTTSCGGGDQTRTRQCTSTTNFIKRYRDCKGSNLEMRRCNEQICPIWSSWSEYNDCSATCGGGIRTRSRSCIQGKCIGDYVQETQCALFSCPEWASWGQFSSCDRCCGGGISTRKRRCSSSFESCSGSNMEEVDCNTMACAPKNITKDWVCGVRPKLNGIQQQQNTSATLLIFGGMASVANTWPWMASLQVNEKHFCGAVLITPQWTLSAAHCYNKQIPAKSWSMVLGAHFLDEPETYTRVDIDKFYPHLDFINGFTANNDIMLVKLEKPTTLTPTIMPSCLPNHRRPRPGETCFIMGWGSLTVERGQTNGLQEAAVPILDHTECRNLGFRYQRLNRIFHMCAGDIDGDERPSDTCTGDSGGPLMCRSEEGSWYVAGVTSFGFLQCGTPGNPGIYAPVANYEAWLEDKITTC